MRGYLNEETKEVKPINQVRAAELELPDYDVEQAYNGKLYLTGYAPVKPEPTYVEKRKAEYPSLADQLDMIYWDKVNNTNLWQSTIAEIKEKYPKE